MSLFRKPQDRPQWPSAIAYIDKIEIVGGYPDYSDSDIEASGAFVVDGEFYAARFQRDFPSTREAELFVERFKLNPKVPVRYNPTNPADNFVEFPTDNKGSNKT